MKSNKVNFLNVLPLDIVRDHLIVHLRDEYALMMVNRACFANMVTSVWFPNARSAALLLPLCGPALKSIRWCAPQHSMSVEAVATALRRCLVPATVTFVRTSSRPTADARLLLALMDVPNVRALRCCSFTATSEDAFAVLRHPKFAMLIEQADERDNYEEDEENEGLQEGGLELGDLRLPQECFPTLLNNPPAALTLQPLRAHHLDVLDLLPDVATLKIYPEGASRDVAAMAPALARRAHRARSLEYEYDTKADLRILGAILETHGTTPRQRRGDANYGELFLTSNFPGGAPPCSGPLEEAFVRTLRRIYVSHHLHVTLGPEIVHPEKAILALVHTYDNHCSIDCDVRIKCCTPRRGASARKFLCLKNDVSSTSEVFITTTPRPDWSEPQTDAWMWDAMEHADISIDIDATLTNDCCIQLAGGCYDHGGSEDKAWRAGASMGFITAGHIDIHLRCEDATWMLPFIQGYMSAITAPVPLRRVDLHAGAPAPPTLVTDPDIAEAVQAARAMGVEWRCCRGGGA